MFNKDNSNANPPILTEKKCHRCKKEKQASEFYSDKSRKDGLADRCKICSSIGGALWRKKNPEKAKDLIAEWSAKNPEKLKAIRKKTDDKKYSTSKGKLDINVGSRIRKSLHGTKRGRHWEDLIGYTVTELKTHLEKLFGAGMTWDNYGQWHIDHKIPVAVFNYKNPEDIDFKKCWSLDNLQPLWGKDNIIKSDKLNKPFQPSLLISEVTK